MNCQRERVIRDRLKDNNKAVLKDVLIISGCAAITMGSVYGTIVLGQDLLKFYEAGETLTLKTRFLADLEEAKVGFALMPGTLSGMFLVRRVKSLNENIKDGKSLRKELKNIKNR